MKTHLKFDELYRLGCALCLKCGLTPPRRAALMDRYLAAVPQPLIVDGEDARVWIDKYYAAYQLGGGDVHYAYLSRTHLEEETRALKELAAQKGLFLSLPGDIEGAFQSARARMRAKNVQFVCDTAPGL